MAQRNVNNNLVLEPLNGKNFYNWKFRIEAVLQAKEVDYTIEKKYERGDFENEEAFKKYQKHDRLAKSLIVQSVEDSQLEILREKESANEMWDALKTMYEKKGMPGQLFLRKKLLSMKLGEDDDLNEFISNFDEVLRQLKAAGSPMTDQDAACNLLLCLPKSYDTLVSIIENNKPEDITLSFVKAKLRAEVEKRSGEQGSRAQMKNKDSTVFQSLGEGCWQCGLKGHLKRNCRSGGNQNHGSERGSSIHRGFNRGRWVRGKSQAFTSRGSNYFRRRGHASQSNQRQESYPASLEGNDSKEYEGGVSFMANLNQSRSNVSDKCTGMLKCFVDSGCTDHLVNDKCFFSNYIELKEPISIAVAKNHSFIKAIGVGNINCYSKVNNERIPCNIKNVFYVPDLRKNLLSVKRLELANMKVEFQDGFVKLYQGDNNLIAVGVRTNLYEIMFEIPKVECSLVEDDNNKEFLKWHKRYGHIGFSGLKNLVQNNLVDGMNKNLKPGNSLEFCESCVNGKMKRLPFSTRAKSSRVLEIVHSDVCGPIEPSTFDNKKYFVTFIDDFSHFTKVYLIEQKSEVFECFKDYYFKVTSMFNVQIHKLRCDNGREYDNHNFHVFCNRHGIVLDFTVPYTPQQNGKAERMNRSLVERARSMIHDAGLTKEFWGEAIRTAAYVMNRGPVEAGKSWLIPAEIWLKKRQNVSNLKPFGCTAYSHIPKELRSKFDMKANKCIMIGYAPSGYRLWNIDKKKVIVARDVTFHEESFYFKKADARIVDQDEWEQDIDREESEYEEDRQNMDEESNQEEDLQIGDQEEEKREKRSTKLPRRLQDYELFMALDAVSFVEEVPKSYEEIKGRDDRKYWENAMKREINSIDKNGTWSVADTQPKGKVFDTRWVYTYKTLENKIEDKYKARLVVRGFAQKNSSSDMYSPVARMTTIRTILAVGNQKSYYFQQLDVCNAFLNGDLEEDVYIYAPEGVGFEPNTILKLKKSLYGLQQSSKCWNKKINETLKNLKFLRSEHDVCLYYRNGEFGRIFLLLYVDDIILCGPYLNELNEIKHTLMKVFSMKDKGELKNFLGLEIDYDRKRGIMKLNQSRYTERILRRFNFDNCKKSEVPIDPKLKLQFEEGVHITEKPYRELIGCLMYLMIGTRPDICFAVNYFSRFQEKPSDQAWNQLKRILRYLRGTTNHGLVYKRSETSDECLSCYVDADWGGDLQDRKSVSGFLYKLFDNTISWTTKKQNCVALSTTEAELISFASAICEGLWLKNMLSDFDINIKSFEVFEDNQGCIAIIKNPGNNRKVKHIELKLSFIYDHYQRSNFSVKYIESKLQQADILTKGLPKDLLVKFRDSLGLRCE